MKLYRISIKEVRNIKWDVFISFFYRYRVCCEKGVEILEELKIKED